MTVVRTLNRSFAGGEITPELYGRVDLSKFQTGLATCRNFLVLPHGPAARRPGFQYILEAKNSASAVRLIPFAYNTEQTYVIELGDQYARFHTNGATVLAAAQNITGITQAATGVLTYAGTDPSNGTWGYLAAIGGMTELNGRWVQVSNVNAGANTFELTDLWGNAIDTSGFSAYTAGGTFSPIYELTTPYSAADLFDIKFVQSADVMTLVHPSYEPRELSRLSASTFQLAVITFGPTMTAPGALTLTEAVGTSGVVHYYKVTAIARDGLEESLPSPANSVNSDLTAAGEYVTIDWADVPGAVRYNVYKRDGTAGVLGYIGQSETSSFIDRNITPDNTITPPMNDTPFSGANNYPSTVSYFEQRRCFANTNNKPQNYWLTRSATESNLTYSIPTRDDDTISGRVVSRQVNEIRHFVSLSDLLVLTSGGEWKISGSGDVLTPSTVSVRPQSYVGAAHVAPQVTGNSVLYVQARGNRIRELSYSWENSAYTSADVSIMAPHLFDGYTLVDSAYSSAPEQIYWAVRSDGTLLGLTYVPEHQVLGWHKHDTDGSFKSAAVVAEGNADVLYVVVERSVDGRTVQYIERLHARAFTALEDWFGVDSGLTYDGAAADTITGLWHLEGETVSILADGAVHPPQAVTAGSITLEYEASVVHVGLPYSSDLKTLPLAFEAQAAGQGLNKNVVTVSIRTFQSSGLWAGPDADSLSEYSQRTDEVWGSPPDMLSGVAVLSITPEWSEEGSVFIRQTDPLPLTVVSMSLEVEISG